MKFTLRFHIVKVMGKQWKNRSVKNFTHRACNLFLLLCNSLHSFDNDNHTVFMLSINKTGAFFNLKSMFGEIYSLKRCIQEERQITN